jgi:ribosome modulation factor
MTVVCSWCRHEGLAGVVGEKAPFEDRREHRIQVRAGWTETRCDRINGAQEVGGYVARSAAHLLGGLRNLSRKAGL